MGVGWQKVKGKLPWQRGWEGTAGVIGNSGRPITGGGEMTSSAGRSEMTSESSV